LLQSQKKTIFGKLHGHQLPAANPRF